MHTLGRYVPHVPYGEDHDDGFTQDHSRTTVGDSFTHGAKAHGFPSYLRPGREIGNSGTGAVTFPDGARKRNAMNGLFAPRPDTTAILNTHSLEDMPLINGVLGKEEFPEHRNAGLNMTFGREAVNRRYAASKQNISKHAMASGFGNKHMDDLRRKLSRAFRQGYTVKTPSRNMGSGGWGASNLELLRGTPKIRHRPRTGWFERPFDHRDAIAPMGLHMLSSNSGSGSNGGGASVYTPWASQSIPANLITDALDK